MNTCLIVDDSSTVRKAIRRIVEGLGIFNVEEAEHGKEALEICNSSMPTLILLDWNMPVMSGLDFLKELRQSEGGKEPKIVMCTTENEFKRITEALEEGANEYIMKPFNEDIIRDKLTAIGLI